MLKLGSLFDGIGGFPLVGSKFGIKPVWASEIEPWPIKVTQKHFPNMKHLGDITKINGGEIEPVDIITFGSPCTRLSVAGKHDGFDITFECQGTKEEPHEIYTNNIRATDKYQYIYKNICPICGKELIETNESALFFHAIRIINEMRETTNGIYPRFIVWENVPGAYSSNNGEDFRAVLEEIGNAKIPMPKSGRWATAGMVRTDTADIAWRTIDAQHWGVPQRRRRIFLVADFGGQCAGEILFVEEGVSGNFAESGKAREEAAGNTGDGTKGTSGNLAYSFDSLASNSMKSKNPHSGGRFVEISKTLDSTTPEPSKNQGGIAILQAREEAAATVGNGIETAGGNNVTATLTASYGTKWNGNSGADTGDNFVTQPIKSTDYLTGWDCQEKRIFTDKGVAPTLAGSDGGGGRTGVGYICLADQGGQQMAIHDDISPTLRAQEHGHQPIVMREVSRTLRAEAGAPKHEADWESLVIEPRSQDGVCRIHHDGIVPTLNTAQGGQRQPCAVAVDCRNNCENVELIATLQSGTNFGGYSLNKINPVRIGYMVRRLTPVECLRLQGYPDWWLDIEGMSDTQKYKAIGNSVAIPCVEFVLGGIAKVMTQKGEADA